MSYILLVVKRRTRLSDCRVRQLSQNTRQAYNVRQTEMISLECTNLFNIF
jgi:hypothetical protein